MELGDNKKAPARSLHGEATSKGSVVNRYFFVRPGGRPVGAGNRIYTRYS